MISSSNPALKNVPSGSVGESASVNGVMNKTFIMSAIMGLGAWIGMTYLPQMNQGLFWGIAIVNFIVAMVYIFKSDLHFLAPVYAITEGVLLYAISSVYEAQFPGIVNTALVSVLGVFAAMLFAYRSGIIKVTRGFTKFMMIAMGGILILYLGSFIASMFGADISFLTGNSNFSIGISLVVTAVASLTLILDFHRIEEAVAARAPAKYEWYLSFGLMISLVWIYLEILRLLAKLRSRD